MATEPNQRLSIAEYLALERASELKHEYLDGEMFAMTGASRNHNLISGNVFSSLHSQVKGRRCEAYHGDMRVRTGDDLFTYPDVVVVCGAPQLDDAELDTLLNPTLLVEVLSKSTASYDCGAKLSHYRTTSSLSTILLIAQDRVRVERWDRQADGRWLVEEIEDLGRTLDLPSIGCTLALSDVYDRVFAI